MSPTKIIKPSNGRIVWFTPGQDFKGAWHDINRPLAAMICHVWSDRMVNLDVVDSNGAHWPVTSVDLLQPGDDVAGVAKLGRYCEWMPYQVGQAAKTEELARTIRETTAGPVPDPDLSLRPEAAMPICTCRTGPLLYTCDCSGAGRRTISPATISETARYLCTCSTGNLNAVCTCDRQGRPQT
jgi:hypothetical protein